jgi:hypothetical protein
MTDDPKNDKSDPAISMMEISRYLTRFECAVALAKSKYPDPKNFEDFKHILLEEVEKIVSDLEKRIANEGITYLSLNEPNATARSLLWAGWVSWVWTSKAGDRGEDSNEARVRPIVEKLMERFVSAGKLIGKNGGRPENYVEPENHP